MKYYLEVDLFNHNKNMQEKLHFRGATVEEAEARFEVWRDKQGKHCSIINVAYKENTRT